MTFQSSKIESTDKVKYLGVTFDEGMTWENQSNQARSKAYFNLIKIKKILSFIDDSTKQLLLNALVFPHISYCLSSWNTANKKCTKKSVSLTVSFEVLTGSSLWVKHLVVWLTIKDLLLLLKQSKTCVSDIFVGEI